MISFYLSMILSFIFLKLLSFSLPTFSSEVVSYFLLAVPNGCSASLTFSASGMKQMLPVGIPSQPSDAVKLTTVTGLETNIHAILHLLAHCETSSAMHALLSSIQPTDDFFAWKGTVDIQETFTVVYKGRDCVMHCSDTMEFPDKAICIMQHYNKIFRHLTFSEDQVLISLREILSFPHIAHRRHFAELLQAWIDPSVFEP
eukprot:GHVS01065767.1.p1 GENE.GHVS01065767.1~~GHVS01065767.1.p1  ORF type:complete len:226 (-),score=13.75 GHVS01065767.1:32-634(-)